MRPWCYVGAAEAKERAERAAMRALELDPMLAEAQISMALYKYWFSDDWSEAEPYFAKAIALHPRASAAIIQHAQFLAARQRFEESIRDTEKAIAIDPLSPIVCSIGALSMYACRRYDRAVELARQALEMYPGFAIGLYGLGLASCQTGDYDGGVEACSRLVEITNRGSIAVGMLGHAYAAAGRTRDAKLLLDELVERGSRQYVDPLCPMLIYSGHKDWDNVADQLEALIQVSGPFPNVAFLISPCLEARRAAAFPALVPPPSLAREPEEIARGGASIATTERHSGTQTTTNVRPGAPANRESQPERRAEGPKKTWRPPLLVAQRLCRRDTRRAPRRQPAPRAARPTDGLSGRAALQTRPNSTDCTRLPRLTE
jgi:Flp pilus assembly protein TadD